MHGFGLWVISFTECVNVELHHARIIRGLSIDALLLLYTLGNTRHCGDANNDSAIEHAEAYEGHAGRLW